MMNSNKFAELLAYNVTEKGYTRKQLAEALGIDRSNISKYLSGSRLPDLPSFIKLCKIFNCSADYLAGLAEYPDLISKNLTGFSGARLRKTLSECKISQYRLQKDLKISGGIVWNWLNDKTTPSLESLIKVAEYAGCSLDYLLSEQN